MTLGKLTADINKEPEVKSNTVELFDTFDNQLVTYVTANESITKILIMNFLMEMKQ